MRISDWSSDVCSSDLVTSQRGASGGYVLSAAPDNITVAQIIQAMEGPIALTACVDGATDCCGAEAYCPMRGNWNRVNRSEEHTSELQSIMRISYAVFCLKKKTTTETV